MRLSSTCPAYVHMWDIGSTIDENLSLDLFTSCTTNAAPHQWYKEKITMSRPRSRDKNMDTNYSMRVSADDRDRFIAAAETLGMSLNAFTNQAISTICELIETDTKKLPHTSELELVKVGQFLKANKITRKKK